MPLPGIIPLPIPVTVFTIAMLLDSAKFSNDNGKSSYTIVTKIPAAYLTQSGSSCFLSLVLPVTAGTISNIYIGNVATTGNAYDFDGNQVEVKFGAASGTTWVVGGPNAISSDEIAFAITRTSALLIAFNMSTSTTILRSTTLAYSPTTGIGIQGYSTGNPIVSYVHSALAEAGTTAKTTGYTTVSGTIYGVYVIDVGN